MKNCKKIKIIPEFETLDFLPEYDINDLGRYIYVSNKQKFFVSTMFNWLPLGIDLPIKTQQLPLNISDEFAVINAEVIPCFSEEYLSNIQLTLYDFNLDLKSLKTLENINTPVVENFHLSVYDFNKISSDTLITNFFNVDTITVGLNLIINISDVNFLLSSDNTLGLYLGDPCFTVSDSLLLNTNFLSSISGDSIKYSFFDSSSNIQFIINNLDSKIQNCKFNTIIGTPTVYKRDVNFFRSNGIDWATYDIISSDEIYAPLTKCQVNCICDDPITEIISLQQSICQLYKNTHSCIEHIKFEYLIDTDDDLNKLKPSVSPITPRIIYDIRTDDVWVWNCNIWLIDECRSVCQLEKNKIYFNVVTRKLFYVSCDCSIFCLISLPFTDNPCSI